MAAETAKHANPETAFTCITDACAAFAQYTSADAAVLCGDAADVLRAFPDHSVSLILADPPYPAARKNSRGGDPALRGDADFMQRIESYAAEWKRVLRYNGSAFCFCPSAAAAKLETAFSTHFNVLSQIVRVWPDASGSDGSGQKIKAETLRHWAVRSERILFMEPKPDGSRSRIGALLQSARKERMLSTHALAEMIGAYGKINHGGVISNWESGRSIPGKEQYIQICEALKACGRTEDMPPYEALIRPFHPDPARECTDVWSFDPVPPYKGRHPTEKPVKLFEQAILATTQEGDVVLDCFAGSGAAAVAALKHGRKAVSVENDPAWADNIANVLRALEFIDRSRYPDNAVEPLSKYNDGQLTWDI